MITFKLNDNDYNLVTSWEEMTLGQWIKIQKLAQIKESFLIEEMYVFRLVDILCDVEEGELDDLSVGDINEFSKSFSFLEVDYKPDIITHVNLNGVDYVFNVNLNKLTSGEYISLKIVEGTNKNSLENIAKILAILIRPGYQNEKGEWVQHKFNAEEIEQRSFELQKMKVVDLLGGYSFFLSGSVVS